MGKVCFSEITLDGLWRKLWANTCSIVAMLIGWLQRVVVSFERLFPPKKMLTLLLLLLQIPLDVLSLRNKKSLKSRWVLKYYWMMHDFKLQVECMMCSSGMFTDQTLQWEDALEVVSVRTWPCHWLTHFASWPIGWEGGWWNTCWQTCTPQDR